MMQYPYSATLRQGVGLARKRAAAHAVSAGRSSIWPQRCSLASDARSMRIIGAKPRWRRCMWPLTSGGMVLAAACLLVSTSSGVNCSSKASTSALSSAVDMRPITASDERARDNMENADLVSAAHEIRLGLAPPHQSLFRVVCILIYEDSSGNLCRLIGTNCESSTIGGAICAERAAMCKLREVTDCRRVTKVVVVTDSPGPLAPGVLCREFLSAHLPFSTPIVMSGSGDAHLLADAGGFQYDKPERSSSLSRADEDDNGKANSRSSGSTSDSDSPLFPLNRREAATSTCAPIGAVAVSDEGEDSASGVPVARVSGCVDVCTLGELYPWRNLYGLTPRGEQVRLGFVRQQASQDLSKAGVAKTLGVDDVVVDAYDRAQQETAEDDRDWVHPIRYAAAAIFPDGQMEITHQVKALEYGATLDPVTLLAPVMIRRAKEGIRPSYMILVDQFGNLHAPFAQARTFLFENGFGDTQLLIHAEDGRIAVLKAKDLVPRVTAAR